MAKLFFFKYKKMSKDYEDKYYQDYCDDYEFLKDYGEIDPLLCIFDIPTDNLSFEISNKSNMISEKESNQIILPQEPHKSQEKVNNPNLIVKKSTNSTNFQEKENLNEKMDKKEEKEEQQKTKTFLSKKAISFNDNTNISTNSNDNKFKDANIRIKCNKYLLKAILDFINIKIKELYNNNIGKGILIKQLQTLQKSESNIKFNQELLYKTIKDIFSDNIYGKITAFPKDYNKKLIENLLNEKDCIIQDYFKTLFSLTFIQCLEHYRGTKFYNELNGMRLLEEDESIKKDDEELYEYYKYYFNNYESIINNKRSRKSRKN